MSIDIDNIRIVFPLRFSACQMNAS